LEARAVITIFDQIKAGVHELVSSDVLVLEVMKNSDSVKRQLVLDALKYAAEEYRMSERDRQRGKELEAMLFQRFDASHIACAEGARANAFLTTDDRLLGRARKFQARLLVRVYDPIQWLGEVSS